jgi:hypothetical protein
MKKSIAAPAITGLLIAALTACATAGDVRVATADAKPGGEAHFVHTSDGLRLCSEWEYGLA